MKNKNYFNKMAGTGRNILVVCCSIFICVLMNMKANAQVPIVYYDFENNATRTTLETTVEQDVNGAATAVTRVGGTTTISQVAGAGLQTVTTPAHNGASATAGSAATSNTWDQVNTSDPGAAATDYYQFTASTAGFSGISFQFDYLENNSNAPLLGIMYSVNGGSNWTLVSNGNFSTIWATKSVTFNSNANNQTSLIVRIYGYDALTSGAVARIDNVMLSASTITSSKTMLNYENIYTSMNSGSTGSFYLYTNFAVSGAGIVCTMPAAGSSLGISGVLTMTNGQLVLDATVNPGLYLTGTISTTSGLINGNTSSITLANSTTTGSLGTMSFVQTGNGPFLWQLNMANTGTTPSIKLGSALSVYGNVAGTGLTFNSSVANNIDLNGQTLVIGNSASFNGRIDLAGTATTHTITSSVAGGIVSITTSGATTIRSSGTTGLVSYGSNVTVQNNGALNCGASLTTFVSGSTLQMKSGSTILTNPPTYASGSTLQYSSGGTFNRGLEWSATSGVGYPANVQTSTSGTVLDLGNGGAATTRQCSGNLTVDASTTFSTNVSPMTAALTVLGDITNNGTLTLSASAGGNLNIGGSYANNGTFTNNNKTVTFTSTAIGKTIGGTLTGTTGKFFNLAFNGTGGVWSFGANAADVANDFTLTAGTVTAPSTTLSIAGNFTNSGTFTHNSGTVQFNGSGTTQTIGGTAVTFKTLTVAGGAKVSNDVVSVATTFNVNGNGYFIHNAAGVLPGTGTGSSRNFNNTGAANTQSTIEYQNNTLNTAPVQANYGNVIVNISAYTGNVGASDNFQSVGGDLRIQNTGGFQLRMTGTGTTTENIGGNISVEGANAKLVIASGNSGAGTPIINVGGNVSVSNGTLDLATGVGGPALVVTGDVSLTGGTLQHTGSGAPTITVSGNWNNSGGAFTAGNTTVTLNKAAALINGSTNTAFNNLTLNNTTGTTISGATGNSVTGTLTLTNGTLTIGTGLTLGNSATIIRDKTASTGGSLSAAPTFTTNVNVTYTGNTAVTTGAEIPTAATVLKTLTINNSGGVTLGSIATVNGTTNSLVFTSGKLITTSSFVIALVGAAAAISGASTSSYVNGTLLFVMNNGTPQPRKYEIGNTVYAPVTLNVSGITGTLFMEAKTTQASDPNEGANLSGINQSSKCNHYWNVINVNTGTYTGYSAVFDLANTTCSGTVGSALIGSYKVRGYISSTWATTGTNTVATTTISATGIVAGPSVLTDYEIGDANTVTAGNNPTSDTKCENGTATFTTTASSSSPTPTIKWQEKVGAGAFTDIADGGIYSGSATTTLTITGVTAGMSGNQYRADFRNINSPAGTTSTSAATLTVTPGTVAPTFTGGSAALCANGTDTYTATTTQGTVTYTIIGGSGASIGLNTGVLSSAGTTNFSVRATSANSPCGSLFTDFPVTVTPGTVAPTFTGGSATLCANGTDTYTATTTQGTVTYTIVGGSGASIDLNTGVLSSAGTTNFSVRATSTNSPCGSLFTDFPVTVTPGTVAPTFTGGSATLCANGTDTYTATTTQGTVTYTIVGGSGASIDLNTGVLSSAGTTNFSVRATSTNSPCGSLFTDFPVTVTPATVAPTFTGGSATLCANGTDTYTATTTQGTVTYTIVGGSGASIDLNTGVLSSAGTTNFSVRATSTNSPCGSLFTDFPVTVTPGTVAPTFTGGSATLCENGTDTYTATTTQGTVTYTIVGGSGASIDLNTGVLSSAGTTNFSVRATSANSPCGSLFTDFPVTVTPGTVAPTFTGGSAALCANGTDTYTATTTQGTVTYTIVGGSGASIDLNTGVLSSAGTTNFSVRATSTNSPCGSLFTDFPVTVTPATVAPTFTGGSAALCANGTDTYTATTTQGTVTYTIVGGSGASIDLNTGVLSSAGTTNFSVRATSTNSPCGSLFTDFPVTVTPATVAPTFTGGSAALCENGTDTYTATTTQGTVTYTIVGGSGASIDLNTGVLSSAGTTNFSVRATSTNSPCGSLFTDFPVTVTPATVAPTFTGGSAALCENGTDTYTATTTQGTVTYTIVGGSGASIDLNTGVLSSAGTTNFSVRATSTNSPCGSLFTDFPVTVTPATVAPTFTGGSAALCANGTDTYTATTTQGTVTYTIVGGSGASIDLNTGVLSSAGTTNFSVRATSTNSPCGSLFTDFPVTVTPTVGPPSTPSPAASTICQASSPTTYTTSASDATSYSWSVTGAGNTIAGTGTTGTVTWNPAFSGTATVSVTANGCNGPSAAGFTTVTVSTLSTAPTSVTSNDADNQLCSGQSVLLTANGGVLGSSPGASYKWYEGSCGVGSVLGSASTLNVINPSAGTHTYYARIEDACGPTACSSLTIIVTASAPTNTSGTVNAPLYACNGQTGQLVTVNALGGPNLQYSWNTGSNSSTVLFSTSSGGPYTAGPFLTPTNQVYAQFGVLGGGQSGYQICVQGTNACGSTTNKCVWIRGEVNGPGPITPPDGVVACQNTSQLYSCGLSNGATIYTWTLNGSTAAITPNGGNNPTNVTVSFPTGFTTAQLCVTAALSCGGTSTSPARCITINKNPANPLIPAGAATVCPGATGVSYSVPAVPGASGYSWTVPANATIAAGLNSPSITVNFPTPYTGSSSVCVTATSSCGASAVKCKTVVSGIPSQPAGITGPLNNICGSIVQYSVVSPPGGLTYTWTNPAGTTLTGQGGSTIQLTVSPTFTSGSLTVVANSALCAPATSAARTSSTFWGRPNNPGTITQNPGGTFCLGASLTFSVVNPPIGPAPYYTWTTSNGAFTSPQGANNIDVLWSMTTVSGTITVKASNSCGLSAGTSSQSFSSGCREEGINTSSANAFSVYPNPAHDKITVSIDVKEQAQFNVKLLDMSGRVILSEDRQAEAGFNIYNLDLKSFAKGIYTIEVQSAKDSWKTKVVVQ